MGSLSRSAVVGDDAKQSRAAIRAMEQAETVVVSQHALCELVWVLDRRYGVSRADIAATIRQLRDTKKCCAGPARSGCWFGHPRCGWRFC